MQLSSKMRFVSAQFLALLSDDLWLRNARHANAMAARLAAAVHDIPGVVVTQAVQANVVFAVLPPETIPILQEAYPFYVWDEATHEVRWMCSWDTDDQDVDDFSTLIGKVLAGSQ
jgi:threonine aldolase